MAITKNTLTGAATFWLMSTLLLSFGPASLPLVTALAWGSVLSLAGLAIMSLIDNSGGPPSPNSSASASINAEPEVFYWSRPSTWRHYAAPTQHHHHHHHHD